jgi:hypothetical protein
MESSHTELRELLTRLTREARDIEEKRRSVEITVALLEQRANPKATSYAGPDTRTNVGRAVEIIRAAPDGLTLAELIEKSAEGGAKPFVSTSISSQLRFQVKRKVLKKEGDRYHAIAR